MSDSQHEYEYESEYDSEYETDSDYDSETSGSEETGVTYTSLEAALAEMTSRLAELDEGLQTMSDVTQGLEHPVTTVAIASFTNPRILETAPFRNTKFRLHHDAKEFLETSHHTVTFAEMSEAIRRAIRNKKEEVKRKWGTTDFLGILHNLPSLVE